MLWRPSNDCEKGHGNVRCQYPDGRSGHQHARADSAAQPGSRLIEDRFESNLTL